MSPSTFPPTPAPSTDISGKSDARLAQLEGAFTLPPAAMGSDRSGSSGASSASSAASDSSYRPISPSSPVAGSKLAPSSSNKRQKTAQPCTAREEYSLPPPPTRSRKIIQMKPRTQESQQAGKSQDPTASKSTASPASAAGTKRKQANGSTAAGRKVARKTAHSLIERRRRSKMNEEFGVLKDMIPACAGQEMHKLAILQASIEYMHYLERCVSELQAANKSSRAASPPRRPSKALPNAAPAARVSSQGAANGKTADEDATMSDAPLPSPTHPAPMPSSATSSSNAPSTAASPALLPSYSSSALPSPAFSAQQRQHSNSTASLPSFSTFVLTSPALLPQPETLVRGKEDCEATAALLMLGAERRWEGSGGGRGRGMSVRDLLRD